ncbi:TPA: prephenate dehydratase [Candidatus Woesearchaeota archaeon]|nr:prephenate dehydratase [Candidatus Woesearchaeota archaeon]HII69559.1 prephenate dehydratase [Candidatus Woesearchaeota archaeon]
MNVATLGPKGTFSHEAVLAYDKDAAISFERTIWDVFDAVDQNKAEVGIVPLENSLSGSVGITVDALMRFHLHIIKEVVIPIKHNLAVEGEESNEEITGVYTHPITYAQSYLYLHRHYPNVAVIETTSNGDSAVRLKRSCRKDRAAIVPQLAAELYGLTIIRRNIQDNKVNMTKFIVVAKEEVARTGNDRTSIAIYPQADKPGLLYNLLGEFARRKINLTKIESVPSKGKLGDYIFYIEFQGHKDEQNVASALKTIEQHFFMKILGSYPRSY